MTIKFTHFFLLFFFLISLEQTTTAQALNLTINRKTGQINPTTSPVIFTATFSAPINVATFTASTIVLNGTATNKVVSSITQVAPNDGSTFDVTVTATNNGTVLATIPASGIALAGSTINSNTASTSSDNGFVLPVNLLYFTAVSSNCNATLNWKASAEINNSYYGIETSTDGKTFTEAVKIASNNSTTGAAYSYSFKAIASGTNYYRLKMVDADGNYTYSKIVAVTATGNCAISALPSASPNPAKDFVTVEGILKGSHLSFIDAGGTLLSSMDAMGSTQRINISQYANGIYMLRIEAADGSTRTLKIVKQ